MGKTYRKEKRDGWFFDEVGDYSYGNHKSKVKNKKRKENSLDEYETDENHVFIEKMGRRK